MIEDTLACLDEEEERECETNQHCIGMKALFRGIVVKDWKGADFNCNKYETLNKVLVCHAVQHCRKCWLHRNECCNDECKQKELVVKWKEKLKRKRKNL